MFDTIVSDMLGGFAPAAHRLERALRLFYFGIAAFCFLVSHKTLSLVFSPHLISSEKLW